MQFGSKYRLEKNEQNQLEQRVSEITGVDIDDIMMGNRTFEDEGFYANLNDLRTRIDRLDAFVEENKEAYPELNDLPSYAEVNDKVLDKIKEGSSALQEAVNATPSIATPVTSFTGQLAGAVTDPINLGTMAFGAGAGKSLMQTFLIEGSINAGVEVVQSPMIGALQRDLGNEFGIDDVAFNSALAFIGGGGLATGIKATPRVIQKGSMAIDAMRVKLGLRDPETAAFSRAVHIDENNPYQAVGPRQSDEHIQNMREMEQAFETGRKSVDARIKEEGLFDELNAPVARSLDDAGDVDIEFEPIMQFENIPNRQLVDDVLSEADVERIATQRADDLRELSKTNDFEITLEDGTTTTISRIVDEIDEADRLVEAVKVCAV